MMPDNTQNSLTGSLTEATDNKPRTNESWISLCDDFVGLEAQCVLLGELLTCISRRETPLAPAGKHGVDMFVSQLNERAQAFKTLLYKLRLD